MIFRAEQHKQRTAQSPRMMRARVCCGTTGRYLSQRLGSEQTPGRVSKPHSSATPTTSIALRMHPIAHPEHPFRNPHVPEEPLWPLNSSVVRRAGCFSCSQHSICCGRLGDCAALLEMLLQEFSGSAWFRMFPQRPLHCHSPHPCSLIWVADGGPGLCRLPGTIRRTFAVILHHQLRACWRM